MITKKVMEDAIFRTIKKSSCKISPEWLNQIRPDVAVLATGSHPIIPNIKDLTKTKTFTARKILEGSEIIETRIIVVGGGQVGCEVAELLSQQGKEVTIVEVLDDIARDMDRINRLSLVMALEDLGVRIITKTRVESVTDQGVWVDCLGEKELIPTDGIVIAVGSKPRSEDVDKILRDKVAEVYLIGDKVKAGGILNAVRDGFDVAMKI